MSRHTKIKLHNPIQWVGEMVTEIKLKEPTGWQAATLGEPRTLVHGASGAFFVDQPEVIAKYLEKCVDHESGADILRLMSLTDALALKGALFDFFSEAEAAIAQEKLKSFASAQSASPWSKSNS